MLDNLTNFASFVSQFTPMKVVFCQKKDNDNDYNDDIEKTRKDLLLDVSGSS